MDIFAAALPGCPRLGAKHMRALMEAFGTAEDVWKASDREIVGSHLLKGKTEASFLAYRKETEPEEIGEKLYRLQIRCVTWEDDLYPRFYRRRQILRLFYFIKEMILFLRRRWRL